MTMIPQNALDFLPGRITLGPGETAEYAALERFHYLAKRPATWAAIVVARYLPDGAGQPARVIGIAVLSYPSAVHRARHRTFGLGAMSYGQRLRWANANLRTISRVVVHPQFRSLGLTRPLIEAICARCTTPLIESTARMGRAHPMFERAGFTRVDPPDDDEPLYYWRRLH